MARQDVKDPGLTAKEKTRLRRKMDREWLPALASSEAKCMVFLFNMVTDWGKSRDRVRQDHFVNGTKSQGGTGLSLRTVIRALASLTEKGAVARLRTPRGHVYTINFEWSPKVETKAKRASSELVPAAETSPVICQTDTSRYAKLADAHFREVPLQNIPHNRPLGAYSPSHAPKKLPAKRHAYVDPLDDKNLRETFAKAFADTYPEQTVASWGAREVGQARLFVNVADKAKRKGMLEAFDWCVRSWRLIMVSRFKWMQDNRPPDFPVIGFMVKFRDVFLDAWNDRTRLRAEADAKGKDRRLRKMIHHRGLTPEEAAARVSAEDKDADLRAELARVKQQRDAAYQRAEAAAVQRQRPTKLAEPKTLFRPKPMSAANSAWEDA